MNTRFHQRSKHSFALISTLLIILVLTIIVVGFMTSVQMEKLNSRSYLNIYKAQLVAQSGLQVALDQLSADQSVTNFHYATAYTTYTNAAGNTVTNLMLSQLDNSFPPNILAVNVLVSAGLTNCTLTPYGSASPITPHVGYVSLTNNNAEIGRFAYWADDEGAKQNINRWGSGRVRTSVTNLYELPLIQPDTNAFSAADMTKIQSAHGSEYTKSNAFAIPTAQTLNLIASGLGNGAVPAANVDNYTMESLSSYLTPEGYPKLDLNALKQLLDNGTVGANGRVFPVETTINFTDLTQGITAPRCVLVTELLNEDGKHGYNNQNPWGYGSLQFITKQYGSQTPQSRQIVANILNYLDNSKVPITDGTPGTGQTDVGVHPTFMGVKSWMLTPGSATSTIQGHPYISFVSPDVDMGKATSGSYPRDGIYNNTLYVSVGFINPWSAAGTNTTYTTEISASITGNVTAGTPANAAVSTYFTFGPLNLPPLSASNAQFSGSSLAAGKGYLLAPERTLYGTGLETPAWNNNGPSSAIGGRVAFSNPLATTVCRLVAIDPLVTGFSHRYLVQDVAKQVTSAGPIVTYNWLNEGTPTSYSYVGWGSQWQKQGTTYLAYNPTPGFFQDAYLVGDPRVLINQTWESLYTAGATAAPPSSKVPTPATGTPNPPTPPNVFAGLPATSDGQQNMTNTTTAWYQDPAVTNLFPTCAEGYFPSTPATSNAMASVGELGFIHVGQAWQTLNLQNNKYNDPFEDWKLLDYVKVGDNANFPETYTNSIVERANPPAKSSFVYPVVGRVDGLVNINTANRVTLQALFSGVPSLNTNQVKTVAEAIYNGPKSYVGIGDVVTNIPTSALGSTDFSKEAVMRQIANAMTVQSQNFTIYVVGENRFKGKTLGKVTLRAQVKLMETPQAAANGNPATVKIVPMVVSTSYE